jgi:outer membrane protein assembly factor BamB
VSYRTPPPEPLVYTAFNGHVFALRRDTGDRVWHREVIGKRLRIAVDDGRVFVLGDALACLDAATGKSIWVSDERPPGDTLLVHGDHVFVGGGGEITAVSAIDGARLWGDDFKGKGYGNVAIAVEGFAAQADYSER